MLMLMLMLQVILVFNVTSNLNGNGNGDGNVNVNINVAFPSNFDAFCFLSIHIWTGNDRHLSECLPEKRKKPNPS